MMAPDLFGQMNNAVLDIQSADLQGVEHPLRKLSRLLAHSELAASRQALTSGVDLDELLARSEATGGSMMGSKRLLWPDDPRTELGLKLLLIEKIGLEPEFAIQFAFEYYYSGKKIIAGIQAMNRQLVIPFVRDLKSFVLAQGSIEPRIVVPISNRIFIVHGHDGEARETVARFLATVGFDPIILHEQANRGMTVIEKVEASSDVGFAVVLLTPDDEGRTRGGPALEPRARQNVLLELGYFIAKLGRGRVCALKRGDLEIPSDFAGVVWEAMDDAGGWKRNLARELEAAGHSIDWNKVMRA